VPLLVENRLDGAYDVVVVVDAPEDVRLERLRESRGMDETAARARIAAQATPEERLEVADFVIDNSGDLVDLAAAVGELWKDLAEAAG
jgi:dephospho-CoA kinase